MTSDQKKQIEHLIHAAQTNNYLVPILLESAIPTLKALLDESVMVSQHYLVAVVWIYKSSIDLRHGIITATSKDEAFDKFVLSCDAKGWISNKSVMEATGWVHEDDK